MSFVKKINFGLISQRLPVLIQTESAECGLACLAMIAGYYNYNIDLATLRGKYSISQKGANLSQLLNISKQMNLTSRSLRLEMDDLPKLKLPCILHWEFSHFVVLKAIKGNKCIIHDPAFGVRQLAFSEVSKSFTGVAVELWPDDGFKPQEVRRKVRFRDLIGKITGLKSSFIQVLLLALGIELFSIISPLFTQWTIDYVIVSNDRNLLVTLIVGFGVMMLVQQLTSAVRAWVMMYISTSISVQWRDSVFRHLLRLPISYFEKRHLGDIVSRFGAVDSIQSTLSSSFFVAILDGMMTIVTLIMMYIYSPYLATICLITMLLYVIGRILWYRPLRMATEEQIIHGAKQQSHFLETIRGVRTIKLFQRQNERMSDWMALLISQINSGVRVQKLQIYYQQLNGLLFGIENLLVLGIGATMVMDQTFTVGVLMAFTSYKGQFSSRISSLVDKFFELKMLSIQTERLADIVLTEPEDAIEQKQYAQQTQPPRIEFDNVSFRYSEHEPYVIKDISFVIEPGQCVALAGASGCGKTTLSQLLCGSLAPVTGDILIDGVSLKQLTVANLRRFSATVLQDDVLFAGSIMDNITFFDHNVSHEKAIKCAMMAAIHHDIEQMPMQYNTLVGDMGVALSGGQKQRILLARALYKQPQLLILDEATSHLDVQLEQHVNTAVSQLAITRLVIAHRPQTLAMVDRIIVIENGTVGHDLTPAQLFGSTAPSTDSAVEQGS